MIPSLDLFNNSYQPIYRNWFISLADNLRFLDKNIVENTVNLLKPNDIYICRTAALTSRRYILYIYSTNIRTEYFKHAA